MTFSQRLATAAVRAWTRCYTWRMEPLVRDARRAEIESDLWEHLHSDDGNSTVPLDIVSRLVLGIPDDLRWRSEHVSSHSVFVRRAAALAVGSALVLACLWLGKIVTQAGPPQPPAAPDFSWRRSVPLPPPPPPPPPPCNPPGIGRPAFSPCTPL